MVVSIATSEDIKDLKKELLSELKTLLESGQVGSRKRWLRTEEVMKLLEVSVSTLQNLRRNGTLPFTRMGQIIFYDSEDIDRMLMARKERNREIKNSLQNRMRK